jgi:hypothetical protein
MCSSALVGAYMLGFSEELPPWARIKDAAIV